MSTGIARGHHNLFETYVDVRMQEIQCAVCHKTVDAVERQVNFDTDALRYTVHCHGDTDTCELTRQQIEKGPGRIEPGYAFTKKRIDGERARVDMPNVLEGSCEEVVSEPLLLPNPHGESD